jgi:hypothetical protein
MFVFMDNIMKLQATIYIKLHSTNATAVRSRHNSEKETFDMSLDNMVRLKTESYNTQT